MIFKVPKELSERPLLACKHCGNPVPNDMLEDAMHGRLEPCPVCGSEQLADNPYNALTYSKNQPYPGVVGLLFAGELFDYTHISAYTPKINTDKKKRINPLIELMKVLIGE